MANPRMRLVQRAGFWAAAATAVSALVSLSVAITTPPRSGPFASAPVVGYPYEAAARFVPRDFLWMYPAVVMMLAFLVLAVCVRESSGERQVVGSIGAYLAGVSFTVIGIDYFIQLRTVQPALRRGEWEGLAVLSQYNPHGVFIALEEFGFLTLALSFGFLGFSLGASHLERITRWVLTVSSVLVVAAFVVMSLAFGMTIEYRFEVAAIFVAWLTLIVAGALLAVVYRRSLGGSVSGP